MWLVTDIDHHLTREAEERLAAQSADSEEMRERHLRLADWHSNAAWDLHRMRDNAGNQRPRG